jgi:hypothetical protein
MQRGIVVVGGCIEVNDYGSGRNRNRTGSAGFGSGGAWRHLVPMEEATGGRAMQRQWPNGWRRRGLREEEDDGLVGLCGPHD